MGIFRLHEGTAFRSEILLHPASCLNDRPTEVMCPFVAVQITETTKLVRIHHEWVEPAGQRLRLLCATAVILQEDTGIVLSNCFQEVYEKTTFIQKFRFRIQLKKLVDTGNILTHITQVFCQIEGILTVHRDGCLYMTAAFSAA